MDEKFLGLQIVMKVCQPGNSLYQHLDDHLNESQPCQFQKKTSLSGIHIANRYMADRRKEKDESPDLS